jgi:hypothetical protein
MRMLGSSTIRRSTVVLALALSFGVASACGSDDGGEASGSAPPGTPAPTAAATSTPSPSAPSSNPEITVTDPDTPDQTGTSVPTGAGTGSLPAGLQALADIAVADLVERRGLEDANAVEVVSVEEVTWSDRSLGCPSKDMQYPQVLTPGTRIVLRADGNAYAYHGGAGQDPFYCPNPQPPRDAAGA